MFLGMSEVNQVLQAIRGGDTCAADKLLVLLYDDLRRLAALKLAHEKPGQTLDATGLVHEAYLRLLAHDGERANGGVDWQNRGHFFAAAAEAMRRILIGRARQKAALKRGRGARRVPLDQALNEAPDETANLLEINEALTALEKHDAQAAQLVKLRFFAGLQHQEAAEALGISRGAADRLWALARAWLFRQLKDGV
jgi:RNA polymerase sigma factor (TIGR02999 family)